LDIFQAADLACIIEQHPRGGVEDQLARASSASRAGAGARSDRTALRTPPALTAPPPKNGRADLSAGQEFL
jgi:hypothetical protein